MEKISDKEYQASLGNGIPSKIQAVDADNNPIVSTPANLLSTLESAGGIKRIFFPVDSGATWIRIMEVKSNMTCSFMMNMICYANQDASIIVGYVVNYDNKVQICNFKQLIGKAGEVFNPNLKYKKDGNTIIVWAKSSAINNKASCINLLHGNASFPMIIETPPEDAIQPTW